MALVVLRVDFLTVPLHFIWNSKVFPHDVSVFASVVSESSWQAAIAEVVLEMQY